MLVLGLVHVNIGRVARRNVLEVTFRVSEIFIEILVLAGQKILGICCTPSAG